MSEAGLWWGVMVFLVLVIIGLCFLFSLMVSHECVLLPFVNEVPDVWGHNVNSTPDAWFNGGRECSTWVDRI